MMIRLGKLKIPMQNRLGEEGPGDHTAGMKDDMDLEPVTTLKWWEKSLGDKIVIVNAQVIYPHFKDISGNSS